MFAFLAGAANDYGKPRRRRRSSSYSPKKKNYYSSNRRPSEFQYFDNETPGEFLVYFIENPRLKALKIGVGQAGRVHQLLNSYTDRSEESENIGWKVLRVGQFSFSNDDYEKGRTKAYEAERRVKFYWKSQGHEPFLKDEQMGFSKVTKKSTEETIWIQTKGWSETIEMGKVCEVSSWKYVTSSPGYIMESTEFTAGRDLLLINEKHAERTRPPDLKFPNQNKALSKTPTSNLSKPGIDQETQHSARNYRVRPKSDGTQEGAFKARTQAADKNGCIKWTGSVVTGSGYGTMLWDGKPTAAHRIAWYLEFGEELEDNLLFNTCGSRLCVTPQHWKKETKTEYKCTTKYCNQISRTVLKAGPCDTCHQRAKAIRRAVREGSAAKCNSPMCEQMSTSSTSYCVECRAKRRATQKLANDQQAKLVDP